MRNQSQRLRKFVPKMTIGDIPYVLGRVLKLKAKSRGQEDAETHARFDKLRFTNSGNNKQDWAVMMAEYISLMEKFEKIADKPSEDRVMLHMYNDILLQDSRTRDLATHIKIANNSITADAMMDKVDALYRDIYFGKNREENENDSSESVMMAEDAANNVPFAGTSAIKKACYHLATRCFARNNYAM